MSILNIAAILFLFIMIALLYHQSQQKIMANFAANPNNQYHAIKEYLLRTPKDLEDSIKPILWIHIPYEYNSRRWSSFGSRSSWELNQPYLFLTVKSIIDHCESSFTICMIDDDSFSKLIPNGNRNLHKHGSPMNDNMRQLELAKLIYIYGGMICPISFLCMRDLIGLYQMGTIQQKMFVVENIDRNITSTTHDFYPNIGFFGAERENPMIAKLIEFIEQTINHDYTAQSVFLADFNRWCANKIQMGQINIISANLIGAKGQDDRPILIDNLLAQHYLTLSDQAYGIWIPDKEILSRKKFEWFARLSQQQVLESNTILGNYMLITVAPTPGSEMIETQIGGTIEGMTNMQKQDPLIPTLKPATFKPNWVGFWKTPLTDNYGLKPNFLGDNLIKAHYPANPFGV
jgi:hypothetical protein